MELNNETISAYKELLANPRKNNLPFPSFREIFSPSDNSIAKHVVYDKYQKIIKRTIPKLIFYIIMDEIFSQKKDENGNLGYCLKILINPTE